MFPPRPDDYRTPDGSVVVPARVVEPMLKLLTIGVEYGRERGMQVNTELVVVLDALREASGCFPETTGDEKRRLDVGSRVTVAEAAARLGCSPQAIGRAIREHRLAAVRVGHQWHIESDDLDRYRFGGKRVA